MKWLKQGVFVAALVLFGFHASVAAETVTRGPYLQQGSSSSIMIKWRTDTPTNSVVRYGLSEGNLNLSKRSPQISRDHVVELSSLSATTRYYYSIGSSGNVLAGDNSYHFKTAPALGDMHPVRLWVIGDSGTANATARAVRDAYKNRYSDNNRAQLMLMLGDNAYDLGTDQEYGDKMFNIYPEILRQTPVWPTLGNHDVYSGDSIRRKGPYYDIFSLPMNGEMGGVASGTEAYYSYNYGNAHFVVLDSFSNNRASDGDMLRWLKRDLAANKQQWLIAYWHHPPYTKGSHDSDVEPDLIQMRENALPILEAHGVDLVLTGHSHSYERSHLIDGHYGHSDTFSSQHLRDGGGGRINGAGAYSKPATIASAHQGAVYAVAGSSGKVGGGALDHEAMFSAQSRAGSLVIDIFKSQLNAVFLDDKGVIRDSFSISKMPGVALSGITNVPLYILLL